MKTNYNLHADIFVNLPAKSLNRMGFMETLKVAKSVFLDSALRRPENSLPEIKPNIEEFLKPSKPMKFIWLGHSSLLINMDGKILLIDPVFSETASPFTFLVKRFQAPVLKLSELPHIDLVLISHDHYDHLDQKTIEFFKNRFTEFVVPVGVGQHLREWGIAETRINELNWGDSHSFNSLTITAAPARHFSGRGLTDRNKTLWASYAIKGESENIYYSGDSGYGDHFKEIGERLGPFDLAFIENGQYNERWPDFHMQPEESLQAMLDLNASIMVPVHWGMFDLALHHWKEPIERTFNIATAWEIPLLTPRIGEMIDTSEPITNIEWWKPVVQTNEQLIQINKGLKFVQELAK